MSSEYEPLFADKSARSGDLAAVQELFREASGPYLRSFWSWLAWAFVLPGAALATPWALARFGPAGVLLAWSIAILLGGAIEMAAIRSAAAGRGARDDAQAGRSQALADGPPDGAGKAAAGRSPLAAWALRTQGNLSLVALALSALLLWEDLAWAVPGLWLLLLGHSFYVLGGIAFRPFRAYGLLYQIGGVAALWPGRAPLPLFALTAAAGNLWMAWAVWRESRG
jgi:hypothetical protein